MKPEHEPNENETDLVKEEAPTPIKYGISDVVLVVEGQEFHVNKQKEHYNKFIKEWLEEAKFAKNKNFKLIARYAKSLDTMKPEQEPKEKEADIVKQEALAPIKYGISGLSDVILVVEGQEFHVHKMALACRSTYFNALFYGNFQEMSKDRIEIKDVAAIPFRRLMDFMYNGKVSDAFPTFKSFRYIANTGFGDLKIKHAHVENRKEYIKNFWKASSEVLEVADRFDVKKSFQTYFEDMLSYNACTTASCFVCVTFYMFSLANALHILDLQFTMHDNNFVKEWLQLAVEANIPRSDAFNSLATYVNAVK